MFVLELLVAVLVALVLTALVLPLASWRDGGGAALGLNGTIVGFFLVVLLGAWVGGLVLWPVLPTIGATSWFGFLLFGLAVAVVLALASGSLRLPEAALGRGRLRSGVAQRPAPALALLGGIAVFVLGAMVLAAIIS